MLAYCQSYLALFYINISSLPKAIILNCVVLFQGYLLMQGLKEYVSMLT